MDKNIILLIVGIMAIAINKYAHNFMIADAKRKILRRNFFFSSKKYFSPKGWKIKIVAYCLAAIFLILLFAL